MLIENIFSSSTIVINFILTVNKALIYLYNIPFFLFVLVEHINIIWSEKNTSCKQPPSGGRSVEIRSTLFSRFFFLFPRPSLPPQGPTLSTKKRFHKARVCYCYAIIRLSCTGGIQVRRCVSYALAIRQRHRASRHRFFLRDFGTDHVESDGKKGNEIRN